MVHYQNLNYSLTARYATITDEGINKAWNENLSIVKIEKNSEDQDIKDTAKRIIESFRKLLKEDSTVDQEKSKITADDISINELQMELNEDPTAGINIAGDNIKFSLNLKSTNTLGTVKNTKLPGGLESNLDSDTVPIINTTARALVALSTNSYSDTSLSTSINIYEE